VWNGLLRERPSSGTTGWRGTAVAGTILISGLTDRAYGLAMVTLAAIGLIGVVATMFLRVKAIPRTVEGGAGGDIATT
jgi:hypothetical protein